MKERSIFNSPATMRVSYCKALLLEEEQMLVQQDNATLDQVIESYDLGPMKGDPRSPYA